MSDAWTWSNDRCDFRIALEGATYVLYGSAHDDDEWGDPLGHYDEPWLVIDDIRNGTTDYSPWDRRQGRPKVKKMPVPDFGDWSEE